MIGSAGATLFSTLRRNGAIGDWALPCCTPQAAVDQDAEIAEHMLSVGDPGSICRIWRNHRALVVPRHFSRKPGFRRTAAEIGLPVALRRSGGTAVMHGPHVLNISLIGVERVIGPMSISQAFDDLGCVITQALAEQGVEAGLGDAPEAHCPGRFSILCDGRKLAGTAAFTFTRGDRRAVVAHANLLLEERPQDLATIMAFERRIGLGACYEEDAHISLKRAAMPKTGRQKTPTSAYQDESHDRAAEIGMAGMRAHC